MKRALVMTLVLASAVLVIAGCTLADGGVMITGTVSGDYFDITSDVTVTLAALGTSYTVPVPVVSNGSTQIGAFLVANVPAGQYAVTITFENGWSYTGGTTYRVNGGAWTGVDGEVVTGSSAPYTFTITIDNLTISGDTTFDVYFGNVG